MMLTREARKGIRIGTTRVPTRIRLISAAIVLGASVGASAAALAGDLDKVTLFNIRAQTLDKALLEFGAQAHVQLSFASGSPGGAARTKAIKGRHSGRDVLSVLLRGTGLSYTEQGRTVEIVALSGYSSATITSPTSATAILPGARPTKLPHPEARTKHASGDSTKRNKTPGLRTITITGTHLRGVEPTYPITRITQAEIAQMGLPNIGDVLQTLPQDFGGGDNPGVVGLVGAYNGSSSGLGIYTANLRGIGSESTLTLVDGERMAYDGRADAIDLSLIPTLAVSRLEVTTGGSSAIYGSDAVAGVVNVILMSDYDGEETAAYVEAPGNGGAFRQRYDELIGRTYSRGSVLLSYEFSKSNSLRADQREQSYGAGPQEYLEPTLKSNSILLAARYDLTDSLSGKLEGLYTHRDVFNESTGQATQGVLDEFGTAVKLTDNVGDNDSIGLDLSEAGTNESNHIYSPVPPTSLNLQANIKTRSAAAELQGSGPLFSLPSGPLQLALGSGFRRESLDVQGNYLPEQGSRSIANAYIELSAPLLTSLTGPQRLQLNAADRYEHYSDFGTTTNPTIGVSVVPLRTVTIKGNWGTSFSAPSLDNLHQGETAALYPGRLWGLPSSTQVLYDVGSNPSLRPETAKTWSATIQESPLESGNLLAEVTYYNISYTNRIGAPITNPLTALKNPLYIPFLVINPSMALQSELIGAAHLFSSPYGLQYNASDVGLLIVNTLQNITTQAIHGVDADLHARYLSPVGTFTGQLAGGWLTFDQQVLPGGGSQVISGLLFNPPRFKARGSVVWSRGAWNVGANATYVADEKDTSATPSVNIGSWTTADAHVSYVAQLDRRAGSTARVGVSVLNLLNKSPPVIPASATIPNGIRFDAANAALLGRAYALSLTVSW